METKQNTNDLSLGMTNMPSDAICPDNAVAAEWNMIFRGGEHRPIQAPRNLEIFKTGSFYILHIHKVSKKKHYVGVNDLRNLVYCIEGRDTIRIGNYADYDEETQVTSIGNTLIVNVKGKELRYFLWKPDSMTYEFIGNKLPKPEMDFRLSFDDIVEANEKTAGIMAWGDSGPILADNKEQTQSNYNALIIGLYSKNKKKICSNKRFHSPFSLRYALKLYDGSYTLISTPIMFFPSISENTYCTYGRGFVFSDEEAVLMRTYQKKLSFWLKTDYSQWKDIIKTVSVFVSRQVEIYDTSADQEIRDKTKKPILGNNCVEATGTALMLYKENLGFYSGLDNTIIGAMFHSLVQRSKSEIIKELSENGIYYKLFDINAAEKSELWQDIGNYINSTDLENIETAEQLDHDDYFSNCPLTAESIYMYNKRLHLSNVSRGFYKGGTSFLPLHTIEYTIIDRVQINTQEGVKVVLNKYKTRENPSIFFYYPDLRAFHVDRCVEVRDEWLGIIHVGDTQCSFDLKTHPLLNGAYYIRDTPPGSDDNLNWTHEQDIPYTRIADESFYQESVKPENLSNEVWVSEVNNPFVFNAQGVNTVGNGEIIGIISNTRAISQGQFGQFPLFCFTTDGVWTLQISSEGTYSSAHPISREVCNNKDSITATDNLVFFSSEKGLMMINGSEVSCVSSQLSGKTYIPTPKEGELYSMANIEPVSFIDFIKKCKIAYDYRDNLLWIVNQDYKHCFLLSIESGAYAMTTLGGHPVNIINDYPDTLIEINNGESRAEYKTLSLINRPNINDDERRISSFIISRPLKIGDQNSLKTPTMIRYIGNNNQKAAIRMRLFASDDLINWVRINSLRGRGFKYYKYNFIFEDLLPTDTFSGVTEKWQFKYQSKFR